MVRSEAAVAAASHQSHEEESWRLNWQWEMGEAVGTASVTKMKTKMVHTLLQDIPSLELSSWNVRKYIMLDQLLF